MGEERTSIPCDTGTKDAIESLKRESETWDECLLRLHDVVEQDRNELLNRIDELEATLDSIQSGVDDLPDRITTTMRSMG